MFSAIAAAQGVRGPVNDEHGDLEPGKLGNVVDFKFFLNILGERTFAESVCAEADEMFGNVELTHREVGLDKCIDSGQDVVPKEETYI